MRDECKCPVGAILVDELVVVTPPICVFLASYVRIIIHVFAERLDLFHGNVGPVAQGSC